MSKKRRHRRDATDRLEITSLIQRNTYCCHEIRRPNDRDTSRLVAIGEIVGDEAILSEQARQLRRIYTLCLLLATSHVQSKVCICYAKETGAHRESYTHTKYTHIVVSMLN